jgi:hypothetical protein
MDAIHKRQAAAYVRTLAGDAQAPMTWQVFDDSGQPEGWKLARIRHGSLRRQGPTLLAMQAHGRGVFCAINATDLQGRKVANVVKVRALFIDMDGEMSAAWHLEPSMIVQSKHGPHGYWLVDDCELGDFRVAQQRLARHYGSDPKVCDLPRVLRVPGFLHLKAEPFRVELLAAPGHRYRLAQVLDGIAALPEPPQRVYKPSAGGASPRWRDVDPVQAFADAGLYGRPLGDGKHSVLCPWAQEHSRTRLDASAGDTVLWESGVRGPVFRCSHAHCSQRFLVHALREIQAWER